MKNKKFVTKLIESVEELERVLDYELADGKTSYYLITSDWSETHKYFYDRVLKKNEGVYVGPNLNIINTFDIPNALGIIRSILNEGDSNDSFRKNEVNRILRNYPKLPMLVIIQDAWPRVISYNGCISDELGV